MKLCFNVLDYTENQQVSKFSFYLKHICHPVSADYNSCSTLIKSYSNEEKENILTRILNNLKLDGLIQDMINKN